MKLQVCLGIASALLCMFQLSNVGSAKAQIVCGSSESVTDGCLKITNEPLQIPLSEIVEGQVVQIVGSFGSTPPNLHKEINRTITWEVEVTEGSENNLSVTYEFPNVINTHQPSSEIPVELVHETKPSFKGNSSNSGKVIVQGSATFKFNLSAIKASGSYLGNLIIRVTE
ncbi:hypothetical protein H6G76_06070 [Nostoc sp. FACHB-152]|uniref:hypothetical protein n=1 Tax=unclassified Nostoc TaxID=2593658 RepID=UPI0016898ABC|nr:MULTISPECIES: hypothetical protein [unclassified Nostoc]MBD2446739.1 hypothetical protein [Nostoc sp. FACHB-152]MBD2466587.1 hypothetical protein [Nostoc sp. FACHB-145]